MKGFTLIELLVVVIIIGILSAIALPQYELVVEKSRATEALVNAKAILDAVQRHIQEFPEDTGTAIAQSQIADVQLKGGSWDKNDGTGTIFTGKYYTLTLGTDTLTVQNNTISDITITYSNITTDPLVAADSCTGTDYEQVCKLFTDL